MPTKGLKTSGFRIVRSSGASTVHGQYQPAAVDNSSRSNRRRAMPSKNAANDYLCAIERNQNGKYNIRVRAVFAPAKVALDGRSNHRNDGNWTLPVYFLASSFNAAMKKLEESLQLLQKNEERLRFWAVERTDDPNLAGDLLQEFGLWLDRRREYPRRVAELAIAPERRVPASMLAPVRRILADSVAQERPVYQRALAGD